MTTVGRRRDFVRYGAAVFDAPVPQNASNVFEQTTFSGTVEMTSRHSLYTGNGLSG